MFQIIIMYQQNSKVRAAPSLQSVMNICAGNLIYCYTPTSRHTTTPKPTTSPTMVVLGTQDKIEDSSWSVFNFHPVSHSAMSAGFFLLVMFLLVMFWFCCRSLGSSGLKKIKTATMGKQTPDILKDLEMANVNSNSSSYKHLGDDQEGCPNTTTHAQIRIWDATSTTHALECS